MNSITGSFQRIINLALVFVFLSSAASGQLDSVKLRPDVFRFTDGVLFTISSPVRWDQRDWLVLGGLVAGTTALSFADQPLRHFWQSRDNRFLNGLERVGYHYGKPYTAVGVTAGFYLTGMLFRNEWAKETGLMLGTSIFSSSFVMGALKNVAGRARPGRTVENLIFDPLSESTAFHAFPSGHSSIAFGISVILAKRVDNVPLKILFYSLAGSTAVSRMYSDAHWFSDIAFGGMLAWFCADTAIERIQTNRFRGVRRKNALTWKVYPYPGGVTLRASVR